MPKNWVLKGFAQSLHWLVKTQFLGTLYWKYIDAIIDIDKGILKSIQGEKEIMGKRELNHILVSVKGLWSLIYI